MAYPIDLPCLLDFARLSIYHARGHIMGLWVGQYDGETGDQVPVGVGVFGLYDWRYAVDASKPGVRLQSDMLALRIIGQLLSPGDGSARRARADNLHKPAAVCAYVGSLEGFVQPVIRNSCISCCVCPFLTLLDHQTDCVTDFGAYPALRDG